MDKKTSQQRIAEAEALWAQEDKKAVDNFMQSAMRLCGCVGFKTTEQLFEALMREFKEVKPEYNF